MKAAIRAIAAHLPDESLTNERLAAELGNWSAADILQKTGIATRRIAAAGECASDLGVAAVERLFAGNACARGDIDYLIFCTQSPDYFLPTTACLMQDRLGLSTAIGALDVNQGCSGWVYGLSLAKGLIESGTVRNVLLITAETYSKYINPRDRSVRTIFGDAAAATLITGVDSDEELLGPFVFGTDGSGKETVIVRAGGAREPFTDQSRVEREEKGSWRSDANIYMNGPEIFNFALRAVPSAVKTLLDRAGAQHESVDYYIFHQANKFMLDRLRNKIGIDESKFCLDMDWCGNTVSSTIPIALERAQASGRVERGARVMAVGFGVGYSWAAAMIRTI